MTEIVEKEKKAGVFKRLYDWVLSWAETKYGVPALFVLSVAESSFFPIPPDPLLLALGLAKPKRSIWFATVCTAGSVIGGAIGYAIGLFFMDSIGMKIIELYGLAAKYSQIQVLYEEWNAAVVLVAGISPIPYKVFTIAGGAFHVSFATFMLASLAGRGFRFYMEGFLIYHYGPPIRTFIDKNITILSWAFAILLVGGFIAMKFLMG